MHTVIYSSTGGKIHTLVAGAVAPADITNHAPKADSALKVVSLPAGFALDSWQVHDGELMDISDTPEYIAAQMITSQSDAQTAIDAKYEALLAGAVGRPGIKLSLYEQKAVQARLFLAKRRTKPSAEDWPWLAAEVGAGVPDSGDPVVDLAAAARLIVHKADAWAEAAVRAERVRLMAKAAVRAATTRAEVQAVLDNLTWPDFAGASAEEADGESGTVRAGGRRSGSGWRRLFCSRG